MLYIERCVAVVIVVVSVSFGQVGIVYMCVQCLVGKSAIRVY